jgi:hypothetical protein
MRVLFNLRFWHCLVSRAGRAGCLLGAWGHAVDYRNSGSFRFCSRPGPRQISRSVTRMNQGRFAAFGSERLMAAACSGLESVLAPSDFVFGAEPNKAPEPTPTSVTPRASSRAMKLKRRIADRVPARGAPDAVVAHL